MTDYFIPQAATVKLASGRTVRLMRGVHPVPDELANSHQANTLGIKPVSEMTDHEFRMTGMKRPDPVAAPVVNVVAPVAAGPAKS